MAEGVADGGRWGAALMGVRAVGVAQPVRRDPRAASWAKAAKALVVETATIAAHARQRQRDRTADNRTNRARRLAGSMYV